MQNAHRDIWFACSQWCDPHHHQKSTAGRTAFEVNVQQGIVMLSRAPEMMSLRDYLDMRYEALKNDGITPAGAKRTRPDALGYYPFHQLD